MFAVANPISAALAAPAKEAPTTVEQSAIDSLQSLASAMDVMLAKLSVSDTPGYLHCMSVSSASKTLVQAMQRTTAVIASAHVEATGDIIDVCSDISARSQLIDARMRTLQPHLQHLGLMTLVRKDLQTAHNAVLTFLEAVLSNMTEDVREQARTMVVEVMASNTETMCVYGF